MTQRPDPDAVCMLLREGAQKHIRPYFQNLAPHQVSFKDGNPDNKVTIADRETEIFLTAGLQSLLPGSFVVGEEGCADDPVLLAHLSDPGKTVWVIDPVDGTGNFERGSRTFCVMVALVAGGQTRMGWIYDVCNDAMAFAEKGRGAFVNGDRLVTPSPAEGKILNGFTGYKNLTASETAAGLSARSLRCAGHEYLRIARGQAVFSVYGTIKPWDHLAGVLLIEEAGGTARKWDGGPYGPADEKGGLLSAATGEIWRRVRAAIPGHILAKQGVGPLLSL